jgi:hypothetical protein
MDPVSARRILRTGSTTATSPGLQSPEQGDSGSPSSADTRSMLTRNGGRLSRDPAAQLDVPPADAQDDRIDSLRRAAISQELVDCGPRELPARNALVESSTRVISAGAEHVRCWPGDPRRGFLWCLSAALVAAHPHRSVPGPRVVPATMTLAHARAPTRRSRQRPAGRTAVPTCDRRCSSSASC